MNKLDYVDRHDSKGIKFGLDNIYELLESFGNPHKELKAIHIAGTNGKGSVGAYLLYILSSAGYKVGRLSSPVVFEENEFAQIMYYKDDYNKNNINTNKYCEKTNIDNINQNNKSKNVKDDIDKCILENISFDYLQDKTNYLTQIKLQGKPSGFEVQVAISLLYFKENKCDIVIIETGMGGKLDATNVFDKTLCDVITPISMDHMNMLGNTLQEIAMNKYGIITNNGNVVTTIDNYNIKRNDKSLIQEVCDEKNAKLYIADKTIVLNNNKVEINIDNNVFEYNNKQYTIRQNGKYQIENAILAIEVINVLRDMGHNINEEKVKEGLLNMHLKGRFDVISRQPYIIADGAHNVAGMNLLLESLDIYFKDRKVIFVTNIFRDKEYKKMFDMMKNKSKLIIGFETENPRSLKCDEMGSIYKTSSLEEAMRIAKGKCKDNDIIVCAGSLSFMKRLYSYFEIK